MKTLLQSIIVIGALSAIYNTWFNESVITDISITVYILGFITYFIDETKNLKN